MQIHEFLIWLPLTLVFYIVTTHFLNKLSSLPPTPFLNLPIIGHLYLLKNPVHRTLAKISNHYGPVILLQFGSRRVIVISSPSSAEECFTKNDIIFANRPRLLAGKILGYKYTHIAWSSYNQQWRNLRKISSVEILSANKLQLMHGIRVEEVKSVIRRLHRDSIEGRLINMKSLFFELMMNVMMMMIAGKRYFGENVEKLQEAELFRKIVEESFRLSGSNSADFIPLVRWLGVGGVEKQMIEVQKKRDKFMQELVDAYKRMAMSITSDIGDYKVKENSKTMLEMLLKLQEKEPENYTDQVIKSFMLNLLEAGTDTSSGTMEWALSLLLNNPEVLQKAQLEIDEHVGNERLLDESDITNLPYLRHIVNETLRMYPAGPLSVPHESSEQCSVGGYRVPTGTMLLVNLWAIQNDPRNWEDPTQFKPERFEGREGTCDAFKLMPFGSGRRSCPGESLSIRIICLGLGSIIQCFDWERVGEDLIDMTEGPGLTLPKAEPLMAYCKVRPNAVKVLSQI